MKLSRFADNVLMAALVPVAVVGTLVVFVVVLALTLWDRLRGTRKKLEKQRTTTWKS